MGALWMDGPGRLVISPLIRPLVSLPTVVVDCHEYVGGLARVAQHVLELTSCDVLVWGGLYIQGHGQSFVWY